MKIRTLATLAACLLGLPTAVQAITIEFEYLNSGSVLAEGSFSFADGATGTLGYDDLTAFDVTLNGVTYTLSGIATFNDYRWFSYDTAANLFNTGFDLCGFAGCGFSASLAAINSAGNAGFFFTQAPGQFAEYSEFAIFNFDTIRLSRAVPEPGSLVILGIGLLGLGIARRRAKAERAI